MPLVIVVLATTARELSRAEACLKELGGDPVDVVAPSDRRRLVLAPVGDESEGARLVGGLRSKGFPAVLRPSGGPQLDGWLSHTRPIAVGAQLAVCFVWSEHDRSSLENVVEIDPDGGFGTGRHPTTRLLLDELASRITGGERVLDVGCGSGVLGLGALRLGASSLVSLDIEPPAIEATRRNAELNGLEGMVQTTSLRLEELDGKFDVVLANIGRAALVELAQDLIPRLTANGWLGVSGFSPPQCSQVAALLRPLEVRVTRTAGEWSAVVLGRPSAS